MPVSDFDLFDMMLYFQIYVTRLSFWPTTYDEIKNKRYNCKIHGLYTGAMYIQTNVSSS